MAFTAASVIASTTSGAAPAGASPRPGVRVEHNLTYGTYDGHPLRLDVYLPPRPGRERAAALLIHGGGFWSGDKEDYRAQAEAFAREGYVGFAIDYTLSGFVRGAPLDSSFRHGYPLQVHECQQALRWIEDHARRFGIDRHRIVVWGGSAGGYLSAMVATLGPGRPGYVPVAAAVALSGPLNPLQLRKDYDAGERCRPTGCAIAELTLARFGWYLGCEIWKCSWRFLAEVSPVDHVTRHTPPFFIYNGTKEVIPLDQATTMAARLRADRVPVQLMVLPTEHHGPPSLEDVRIPIARFLAAHVPPPPPPGHVLRWVLIGVAAVLVALGVVALLFVRRRRQRGSRADLL